LGLVQDEPSEDDKLFTQEGITYIVNKDLFEQVRPIKVDFIDTPRGGGFFIFSNLGKDSTSTGCC
jgi:iron-sulfur cluster assembly protein